MKSEIYESLHVINAATQQITEHIGKLESNRLLTPHFAEIRRLAAVQNCAETCLSAMLSLVRIEENDAARFEKERIVHEDQLKSL